MEVADLRCSFVELYGFFLWNWSVARSCFAVTKTKVIAKEHLFEVEERTWPWSMKKLLSEVISQPVPMKWIKWADESKGRDEKMWWGDVVPVDIPILKCLWAQRALAPSPPKENNSFKKWFGVSNSVKVMYFMSKTSKSGVIEVSKSPSCGNQEEREQDSTKKPEKLKDK
jgi:hypothetical protein